MTNNAHRYRIERPIDRLRGSRLQQYGEQSQILNQGQTQSNQQKSGFFSGAYNFAVNNSTFVDQSRIIQNFDAGMLGLSPVLELLAESGNLDASMDSSARFPPPLCHPGTRLKIGDKLFRWLVDPERKWNMEWLYGPAGTGKSAVAQTFAEHCAGIGRLGASFFFSRINNRNEPNTIIPTLVYQLALQDPIYKNLITAQLANDPELLRKTRQTQFRKLIIEPFSSIQIQNPQSGQEPLVVILDGLDECEGEDVQRELIVMIGEVVRLRKKFPLIWLICSRPESHLKRLFSTADFSTRCGHEELAIDAESTQDVDFYIRDGLKGIKVDNKDVTTPVWPSESQITELLNYASGHFGFASTSLRYIGDPTYAAPMSQLDALLSFLGGIRSGDLNPLEALDALYTRILLGVSDEIFPITRRILGYNLYHTFSAFLPSTQSLCNFLRVDQATFYRAFRKLHSVINMPSPEVASRTRLHFYHTSFQDYLFDPRRSGKFAVDWEDTMLDRAKMCLFWYKTDLELYHTTDGSMFNESHNHESLPNLRWITESDERHISFRIASSVETTSWLACYRVALWDEALLSQIQGIDFRYIRTDNLDEDWWYFINRLWKYASNNFIRTEPQGEIDLQLLERMESVISPSLSGRPALFPLELKYDNSGRYFLLGYGLRTIVCWVTGVRWPMFGTLTCDERPSEELISNYQAWLARIREIEGNR